MKLSALVALLGGKRAGNFTVIFQVDSSAFIPLRRLHICNSSVYMRS